MFFVLFAVCSLQFKVMLVLYVRPALCLTPLKYRIVVVFSDTVEMNNTKIHLSCDVENFVIQLLLRCTNGIWV